MVDDPDEDEDVIFQGSQLHAHLTSADYDGPDIDFYDAKNDKLGPVTTNESVSLAVKFQNFWNSYIIGTLNVWFGLRETDHEAALAVDVIEIISSSNLVSLDDQDFLQNIFTGKLAHNPVATFPEVSLSLNLLGALGLTVVLIATPSVPWLLRIPSILYTTGNIFNVIKMKMKICDYQKLNRIVEGFKETLCGLQTLCSLLSKSVQFVQEMELIDRGFTLPNLVSHLSIKTVPDRPSALLCLPLRQQLLEVIADLHEMARSQTLKIRAAAPLSKVMDDGTHYLACRTWKLKPREGEKQPTSLQFIRVAIRQCNDQLSEMLRRLALSFLDPLDQLDHQISPRTDVWRTVDILRREISPQMAIWTRQVESASEYYMAWKVNNRDAEIEERPTHFQGLQVALHGLERHLRAAALITDELRREDECADGPQRLQVLKQLKRECQAIGTCYQLIQLEAGEKKSARRVAGEGQERAGRDLRIDGDAEGQPKHVLPLYGQWEPQVEDEILEADLTVEPLTESTGDDWHEEWCYESREERLLRRKQEAHRSRCLLGELQQVLRVKADQWALREARAMERAGKSVAHEGGGVRVVRQVAEAALAQPLVVEAVGKFNAERAALAAGSSNFSARAALAAQVRALASQRPGQHRDVIFADCSSSDNEDDEDGTVESDLQARGPPAEGHSTEP